MMTMKKHIYLFLYIFVAILYSCTDEDTQTIEARFTSEATEIEVGKTLAYKDESLGNPTKWTWYFEGGTPETSVLHSPAITYNTPGTYTVRLVVGRGDASAEIEETSYVVVNYPSEIKVDFVADKTIATNEDVIVFTDRSSGFPSEWEWEFIPETGETVKSTDQHPSINFLPGVYTVKLTAKNPKTSASKMVEKYLTVIDKNSVAADFKAASRDTYAGGNVKFMDVSSGNVTKWEWVFEGGTPSTSTEQFPTVVYNTPGKYKVTLIASNDVKNSTMEKEQYISVIPSEDLVLFLTFDGVASDFGPYNLHPSTVSKGGIDVLYNAESRYSGQKAEGRSAAKFSSTSVNSYGILSLPESDHLDFQSSDFTVSFWAKTSTIGRNMAVFHHGAGPGYRPDNENRQSWFRFQPATNYVVFCVEQKGFSGNWVEYKDRKMDDGEWHHYVCIYKTVNGKKNGYLYIDGVLVLENKDKPVKSIDKYPYYIGCNYRMTAGAFTPENFLDGYLDDYIVYNRALSDNEINALFDR